MSLARSVRQRRGVVCAVLAGALATSACGLKPEVKDQLAQGGGGGGIGATTGGLDASTTGGAGAVTTGGTSGGTTGLVGGSTGGTTGSVAGTTGGTSGGATGGSASGGTTTGGSTTGGGSAQAPVEGKGNTTGIDFEKKEIRIVMHGPLTGAGVPQESFRTGGPKYWEKSGPNGGPRLILGGFKVIAEAVDDKYNAQDALRACNAAAKTAFLIVGGAGTDQIQACGQSQVLRRGNTPYLSSGVTETGLGSINTYFATSLTYKQQSPLVIKMARENGFLQKKWAVVITGTPNFADARESIVAELKQAGVQGKAGPFGDGDIYLTDKAPNNCVDIGTKLRTGAYETVYFLGQPLFFGQCVNQHPSAIYTGPGPSFGIQSVADLACRGGAAQYRGFYLHPTPDKEQSYAAAKKFAPSTPAFTDDIEAGIWGGMQGLEQAFNLVQGPLSRESFIAALAKAGTPGGVLNPAVYNGGSRFGGTGAFVNKITCSGDKGVIKTLANYKIR